MHPRKMPERISERHCDNTSNQHHARDCSESKNEQEADYVNGAVNRREYQERHGGGTCQPVYDSHNQRSQSVKPSKRRSRSPWDIRCRYLSKKILNGVRMDVQMFVVNMGMRFVIRSLRRQPLHCVLRYAA